MDSPVNPNAPASPAQDARESWRPGVLAFVESNRLRPDGFAYRYADGCAEPTLYASCYAALTRDLLGDLDRLDKADRCAWLAYLQAFQDKDGLFRDPVIFDQGWYRGDPLWCGRLHLTAHVLMAMTCLGGVAKRPITAVDRYLDPDSLTAWLAERDWGARVDVTGNEVMNVGVLLQYTRDFQGKSRAGHAVTTLLDWLSQRVDPVTGLWGSVDVRDPLSLSHAVMAAYHFWLLFFYDRVAVPHAERAIDALLATQNPRGGFGWGAHNGREPFDSSACEDIDSIDPLARLLPMTDYRSEDVRSALNRAADHVLRNRTPDGGFTFMPGRVFEYGHPELRGPKNCGAMFPTWFRVLSLALISRALPGSPMSVNHYRFKRCPGMQF